MTSPIQLRAVSLVAALALALPIAASAQEAAPGAAPGGQPEAVEAADGDGDMAGITPVMILEQMGFVLGPTTGDLGQRATVKIDEGYAFAPAAATQLLLQRAGNPTSGAELGAVTFVPDETDDLLDWFVVFEFDDIGFVEDDDKDDLDADDILESIREGTEQANAYRREHGAPTMRIIGWEVEPNYNEQSRMVEWAVRGASAGEDGQESEGVNYNLRILGRRGVMEAVLVVDPEDLATTLPKVRKLLDGYAYEADEDYSAFEDGDKIAEYGIAALVAGGALAVAAKTGLLQKFWKLILGGLVALGAAIKAILGRGKKASKSA